MSAPDLHELRLAMLRGGVAPRYVRRTLEELREHFHDLEQQALADGANRDEARQRALEALGDEQTLLDSVLAREELRSWSARFPKFVYLLSPIAVLILVMALSIGGGALLASAGLLSAQDGGPRPVWLPLAVQLLFGFNEYLLTPALAISYYLTARSRMMNMTWPVAGIVLLAFIGSGWDITVNLPSAVSEIGTLQLTWGYAFLGIPVPEGHTGGAVMRMALTLGLTAIVALIHRPDTGQRRAS